MASPITRYQDPLEASKRREEEPCKTNKGGKILPDQSVLAASDASNATGVKPTPVCPPTPQRTPAYLSGRSRMHRQNSLTDTRALLDESGTESPSIKPQHKVSWITSFRDATILGKGSFSVVFKAISNEDGRAYAVKRTLRPFRSRSERAAILHEFRVSQALGYHPNIIHYKLAWQEEGHVYMQMDLCTHGSYSSLLKNEDTNPLPETTIWNYIYAVSSALQYIHSRGLVHLDIKPDNIFIGTGGRLKIGDLGLVRVAHKPVPVGRGATDTPLNVSAESDDTKEGTSYQWTHREEDCNEEVHNDEDTALHIDHLIGCNDVNASSYLNSLDDDNQSYTRVDNLQPRRPVPSRSRDTHRNSIHNVSVDSAISHLSSPEDEEGDVRYMAAELLNSGNCKPPADVFSLGMSVLEQVYASKLPLDGEAWHALREGKIPPLPAELSPETHDQKVEDAMMDFDSLSHHDMWKKRRFSSENYSWDIRRSRELLSLLLRMLHPDPDCRPTAEDVLETSQSRICEVDMDPVLRRFSEDDPGDDLNANRSSKQTADGHFEHKRKHPRVPLHSFTPGYEERNKNRPLHIEDLQSTETSKNASLSTCKRRNSLHCSTGTNPTVQQRTTEASTQRNTLFHMEDRAADVSSVKRKDMFDEINFSPPHRRRYSATPDVGSEQVKLTPEVEPRKYSTQENLGLSDTEPQAALPSLQSIAQTPQQKTKSRVYGSLTGRKSQRAGRISPSEDFSHNLSKQFENLHTTTSKCFAARDCIDGAHYDSPRRLKAPFVTSTSRPAAPEALSPRSRHQMYDTAYETTTTEGEESNAVSQLDFSKPMVDTDAAEIEAENRTEDGVSRPGVLLKPFSSSVNGNPVPYPIKASGSVHRLRSLSEDGRETPKESSSYQSRENSISSNSSWNNIGESFPRRLGLNPMISPSPRCETPNQPIQYNWQV